MIKIIKHGNIVKRIYFTGCPECGCEFQFDRTDYVGENGRYVGVKCPECGYALTGKYMCDIALTAWNVEK